MEKDGVYRMVTDKVVEMINQGRIPWTKPWHFEGNAKDSAINYVSRKPYSMLNQWLLDDTGEYLTFKQIQALGGKVKKGAKSKFVVFFTQVPYSKTDAQTGEEEVKTYPLLRYYNVFHIKDTEGIPSKLDAQDTPVIDAPMCDEADSAIALYVESQPTLRFQNDKPSGQAYYSPSADKVVVPMRSQFAEMAEYYSTAFHELTHSTLIESRCNRTKEKAGISRFGSTAYSREELVAEMGAAMLCSNFGIDTEKAFRNSIAYLQSWVSHLKDDVKAIVVAAGKAEKAARYILGERN